MGPADHVRDVALGLFARDGYHATSMRDIARAAGLSAGAFYHHYPSKDSVLLDIMASNMQRLTDSAAAALDSAGDDRAERLRALVRAHVVDHGLHPESAVVVDTELRALSPQSRATIGAVRDAYEDVWRLAIDELAGDDPRAFDARIVRFALIQMCTGVAHWYRADGPLTIDKIADEFAEIAVTMVRGGAV